MQRYFLEKPFDEEGIAFITGTDSKHINRVMRMAIDDQIIAVSDGIAFICTIKELLTDSVTIHRVDGPLKTNEMPVRVSIACGLPKGDKLDLIVQKGTELGMTQIIPFKAERSIVKWDEAKGMKKIERLRKIAKEAAEQCHRSVIPKVNTPLTMHQLLQTSVNFDVLLFADEENAKSNRPHRIVDHLKTIHRNQNVLVVFGPEGGLSRVESQALLEVGFLPTSLGPRILRTETAPLYLLSAMSCEFE